MGQKRLDPSDYTPRWQQVKMLRILLANGQPTPRVEVLRLMDLHTRSDKNKGGYGGHLAAFLGVPSSPPGTYPLSLLDQGYVVADEGTSDRKGQPIWLFSITARGVKFLEDVDSGRVKIKPPNKTAREGMEARKTSAAPVPVYSEDDEEE